MTRAEHLEWAKGRALALLDRGQINESFSSMISDLKKHPELEYHLGIVLGMNLFLIGDLSSSEKMREFIIGFN